MDRGPELFEVGQARPFVVARVAWVVLLLLAVLAFPADAGPPSPADKVGFAGWGSARIGMPLWELLQAFEHPVRMETLIGECTHLYLEDVPEIAFMIVEARLARIEVRTSDLSTFSGSKVGDPEAKVLAAYGARVESEEHEYQEGHYLKIVSDDRKSALVFETVGGVVQGFRIGRLPEALWVEGCS